MPTGARLARTDDVDDIAAITEAVWRERLVPRFEDLDPGVINAADFAATWGQAILAPPSPLYRVAVATDDADRTRGYAAWGPCTDPDAESGDVEILTFEIDPPHRRMGHGSRLLSAVAGLGADQGAQALSMWCDVADEPRRAFFVSSGWAPDSAWRDVEISNGALVREVRLVTSLV
jgi:GNAT superfamily N-acetyltransferase